MTVGWFGSGSARERILLRAMLAGGPDAGNSIDDCAPLDCLGRGAVQLAPSLSS
jgi:hypothetical protein